MNDRYKTKAQLLQELHKLRKQNHHAVSTIDINSRSWDNTTDKTSKYFLLFNTIPEAIFVYHLEIKKQADIFLEVNDAACRLLGYSREELLSLTPSDITSGEKSSFIKVNKKKREAFDKKEIISENTLVSKDGTHIPVELSSRLFDFQGKSAVLTVARDISERKRIKEELQLKALLLDNASDTIILRDFDGNIVYANEVAWKTRGYTREEFMNKSAYDMTAPEFIDLRPNLDIASNNKTHSVFDCVHITKNGSRIPVEINSRMLEFGGRKLILSIARDISERQRITEESQLKALLLDNASDAIILRDFDGRIVYANEVAYKTRGYTKKEFMSKLSYDIVAPEFAHLRPKLDIALNKKNHTVYDCIHVSKDGSRVPVEVSARILKFGGEKLILCIARDVSERKRIEEDLKLKALLLDNATDVIFLHDLDGHFFYMNKITCKNLGYTREELMNKSIFEIISQEFIPLRKKIEASLNTKKYCYFESTYIAKDGSMIPVEVHSRIIESGGKKYILSISRDIGERKKIEEELTLKAKILDNATDSIFLLDFNNNFVYVNKMAYKSRGYRKEELMGMKTYQMVAPEYLPLPKIPKYRLGKRKEYSFECVDIKKDGSHMPVEVKPRLIESGGREYILSVVRDITERKYMEEALRESEVKYRTLVEYYPDGIISVDRNGQIIDCNRNICELTGYKQKEISNKHLVDLLANRNGEELREWISHLDSRIDHDIELEIKGQDDHTVTMLSKKVPLYDEHGIFKQAIIYLRNVTESKKIDQLKDEFIGLVSHQLCSPLTVIIGATKTALSDDDRLPPDKKRQLLQITVTEAEALYHMVSNLLELSRLQSQRLMLDTELIDIEDVIKKVVARIKHEYNEHRFNIVMEKNMPRLYADRIRLDLILYNIIENAAKYSRKGTNIRIFTRADAKEITFGVMDHGIGIPSHSQSKLFEPFQRVVESHFAPVKGAGLGLLVCKRLVEVHGGKIWVESRRDDGSTFYFTLPLGTNGKTKALSRT